MVMSARRVKKLAIRLGACVVLDMLEVGDQVRYLVPLQGDLRHIRMPIGYALGKGFLQVRHRIASPEVA